MLTRHVAGRVYNYDYCIGRGGAGGDGFIAPVGFAVGSGRSLYVVNRGNEYSPSQGITKCTLDHKVLWEDRGFGFAGGESPWPTSVAADSDENVYISDDYVSRIFMYDKDGDFKGSWGRKGSGDGELDGPSGLAFDKEDNLYIVDSLNNRVQKFTRDGKFLAKWGSQGSGAGQFNMPWGIAIDKDGSVYVADWKNNRVEKFTPDGEYLATLGSPGTGDGEMKCPSDIAIDDQGDVYVVDWGNLRLNIYEAAGRFITAFIGDADTLSPWAQGVVNANPDYRKARRRTDMTPEQWFQRPVAVNVDSEGRIMVLETERTRIQIYIKEKDFIDAQFNL